MELHKLIDSIRDKTSSGELKLKHHEKILSKLEEMESMIEMEDVKNAFVSQLLLIILMKNLGYRPPFSKMHSVLSGPPGVGKTSMSIIMAEIWDALGLLRGSDEGPHEGPHDTGSLSPLMERNRDISSTITDISDKISDMTLLLDLEYSDTPTEDIPEVIKSIYTKIEESAEICQDLICRHIDYIDDPNNRDTHDHRNNESDTPYIVIGRGDLVGTHQGHTSVKTQELLEKNAGKIIIIEEAYTLFTDERDSYGMEALTVLVRFMSERPNDYIFIFNGYYDKLEQSIFKAQPGLKRRIQWTFKIEKYSYMGLFKIFQHQLGRFKHPKWKIRDDDAICFEKFFKENYDYFPYYGGNTENLILFCQLRYGEKHFCSGCDKTFELEYDDLIKAFERYKISNISIVEYVKGGKSIEHLSYYS